MWFFPQLSQSLQANIRNIENLLSLLNKIL